MDGINKGYRKKKEFFIGYDMIFEQPVSEHAQLIYLYLCRCADGDGQSFPSIKTIAQKCHISESTAYRALAELENVGLLTRVQRFTKRGSQTSNLYTVWDSPCAEMAASDDTPPVTQTDPPCHTDRPPLSHRQTPPVTVTDEGILSEGIFSEVLPSEGEKNAPTPTPNIYGEYKRVRLTDEEYVKLVSKYGEMKVQEYIGQLDRRIAGDGKQFADHCATIEIWIKRDEKNTGNIATMPVKKNRFNNFESRKRDYAEIERLERQKNQEDIKIRPTDGLTSERA